jgi:oligoribonuclease NrnB/cAMP/cGMP phosphodiesterase (DHH superfamily)
VLLVDFSYKRPVLERMAAKAQSILILDHHETAQEDLSGFLMPPSWEAWLYGQLSTSVTALFDMQRSGAGIAADYFEIDRGVRPDFVDYIQDRDLWRKRLPGGDEFTIALRSYPQEFVVWDELARDPEKLIDEGKAIQRYREAIRRRKRGRRSQMENGRCPMKLENYHSAEDKKKWKIVRLDKHEDVPGDIVTADEDKGECSLHVGGETKTLSFGPGGIRIVRRER